MPARPSTFPAPRQRTTPLTQQTRQALLSAILAKRFEGGRLPPEPKIAESLGVSRTTVRHALQSLEQAGVVHRAPGRGTVVRASAGPAVLALQRLVGFSTLLEEQGYVVTSDVTWQREADLYEIRKLIRADGAPAISIVDAFAASAMRAPLGDDVTLTDSAFSMSDELFVERIDHAVVELVPRTAGPVEAEVLGLPLGAAFLHLREVHYTADDEPVGVTDISTNPAFVQFQVFRR
jgi:GntR family transcriptional regulator